MLLKIVRILTVIFLLLAAKIPCTYAKQPQSLVSVFDVKQEKVVQAFPMTSAIRSSLIQMLQSSPVVYEGLSLEPKNGVVVHFSFDTPLRVSDDLYPSSIREMYLFLEPETKPKGLLFLTAPHRPMVVVLHANAGQFLKEHFSSY
jgi:hypothetical protein